jgi:ubiquinone biosynthesis monooxygenase Coq7
MGLRNFTTSDVIFLLADDALTTLFGKPRSTGRKNPGVGLSEELLSSSDTNKSAELMRVNHSGEVCAQALYRSQALMARSQTVKKHMIQSAREENDHLNWCETRLNQLGAKKSVLNPIWYGGSFVIGTAAGLIGDRWSLGFLAETERQVGRHLERHINRLPRNDSASRAIIEQMRKDECNHAASALENGGKELPHAVKELMRIASYLMTKSSQWL